MEFFGLPKEFLDPSPDTGGSGSASGQMERLHTLSVHHPKSRHWQELGPSIISCATAAAIPAAGAISHSGADGVPITICSFLFFRSGVG